MDFSIIHPKQPAKKSEPPAAAAAPPPAEGPPACGPPSHPMGSFMEEVHRGLIQSIDYTNIRSWRLKFGDDYYSNDYYGSYRQRPMGPPPPHRMRLPPPDKYRGMSHQLALPPPDYHRPYQMDYHYGPPTRRHAYGMDYHYGPPRRDPYQSDHYGPPRRDPYPMDYPCGLPGRYPCYGGHGGGYWGI